MSHGNSVLALGTSEVRNGSPEIPDTLNGLPIGRSKTFETDRYQAPYKHFIDNPFMGTVSGAPGFPGFHPLDMNAILRFATQGVNGERTTTLTVDSTRKDAGVSNIPFVVKQADAVSMKSTFWIQELEEKAPPRTTERWNLDRRGGGGHDSHRDNNLPSELLCRGLVIYTGFANGVHGDSVEHEWSSTSGVT